LAGGEVVEAAAGYFEGGGDFLCGYGFVELEVGADYVAQGRAPQGAQDFLFFCWGIKLHYNLFEK
jgi:hypothetical protein